MTGALAELAELLELFTCVHDASVSPTFPLPLSLIKVVSLTTQVRNLVRLWDTGRQVSDPNRQIDYKS